MAHLTLTGVSDDGKRLLLVSEDGSEHTVDIDPRLRAALAGDTSRRLEIQMESTMRPRDIQARIRAGETPEAVAQAAQTSVDRIMAFAAPVLAERQHVADRAQRSSVRRRSADAGAGAARTLGDAVSGHLRSLNIDPGTVEWDAWRREDGRWSLTGQYAATRRTGSAHFTYDGPGNYVTADNDDARWLLGELAGEEQAEEVRDDLGQARQRRLSSVPEDELPLGVDAIELVSDPDDDTDDDPEDDTDRLGAEQPLEAFLDEDPPADEREVRRLAADAAALDTDGEPDQHDDEPPSRRAVKKSRGRASVPSWDEIMFGGGKQD
jgi:hypothetical protein